MKALLIGGTGTMGVELARILLDQGCDVCITTRSGNNVLPGTTAIIGNARDNNFLRELAKKKWDVVVDFLIYSTDEFRERIDCLLELGTHYIFLSSGRVYADSKRPIYEDSQTLLDTPIDEKYLATDEYALSKARQENILKENVRNGWTIVRPYITYGKERLQLGGFEKENWLYRALDGREIVFNQQLAQRKTTLTCSMDVAKCIAKIAGCEKFFSKSYNLVTSQHETWGEVLRIYLDVIEDYIGTRPKVKYVTLEEFYQCSNSPWQLKYDRLYDRTFDNSKILNELNVSRFIDIEEGIRSSVNQFLIDQKFRKISWRLEAKRDSLCNQKISIERIPGLKNKLVYVLYRCIS